MTDGETLTARRTISRDDETKVLLGLLEAVEREEAVTQRVLARELDVALGLVNAYLKRCIKKGFIKVQQVPKRRFAYYLTPQGFTEKSRLTASYLSYSFDFFRRARHDCQASMRIASSRGWRRLAFVGASDLAEVALICAMEEGITVHAIVDRAVEKEHVLRIPVVEAFDVIRDRVDAVMLTQLSSVAQVYLEAIEAFGEERVLVPALLNGTIRTALPKARNPA